MDPIGALERGRARYAEEEWQDAFSSLAEADRAQPLEAEDLELLCPGAGAPGAGARGSPTGGRGPGGDRGRRAVADQYPSRDGSAVTCLWEAPSVESVQAYVDSTLGDSSENSCYEVDAEHAFSRQPLGLRDSASAAAS